MAASPIPHPGGRAPAPAPLDLIQDFVNTEIPEWHRDDLGTPGELAGWLAARGLLDGGALVSADEFLRARDLRAALRELLYRNTEAGPLTEAAGAGVDGALGAVPLVACVTADGSIGVRAAGVGVDRALGELLAIVVASARDGSWSRLKACAKDSCRWAFFDQSRNRTSSWCSMSICGNRVKTSLYRRRRTGQGGA
ncbi:MAG TPA: CGNR zinc finger domain-containing protein [Gaiellaceae bacterium]